mmetsp:Transcript_8835/g.18887  ORF Transcript_8835/g.18887 Transcript_8835/m.18887 type:complete len:237 (-) Transcript_8835:830-1540(-)
MPPHHLRAHPCPRHPHYCLRLELDTPTPSGELLPAAPAVAASFTFLAASMALPATRFRPLPTCWAPNLSFSAAAWASSSAGVVSGMPSSMRRSASSSRLRCSAASRSFSSCFLRAASRAFSILSTSTDSWARIWSILAMGMLPTLSKAVFISRSALCMAAALSLITISTSPALSLVSSKASCICSSASATLNSTLAPSWNSASHTRAADSEGREVQKRHRNQSVEKTDTSQDKASR